MTILAFALAATFSLFWFLPYYNKPIPPTDPIDRARHILAINPLVDGHNDVPYRYRVEFNDSVLRVNFGGNVPNWHTDIPRLRLGQVGAQFWSVYTACNTQGKDAVRATLEQIDVVHKLNRRYPDSLALALSPTDIRRNFAENKISSLIGIEGAHQIDASMGALRMLYLAGARYMTLSHNCNNEVADSAANGCTDAVDCRIGNCTASFCTAPQTIGITPFGEEVLKEMNRLGMLIDISHVSAPAMLRAMNISVAPVIFSHSSAFALCSVARNVPNDVLLKLKQNNGIVMIAFLNNFITCSTTATVQQVVDHIDYIAKGVCPSWKPDCNPGGVFPGIGVDNIGYGSDFDGADYFPDGLKDVSGFVNLTAELFRRQYTDADVEKIIGGNLLRVFDTAVAVSEQLRDKFPGEDVIWPKRNCRLPQ